MTTDTDAPCFMCDPSILEGARCATGFPLCDTHREGLTGNMNPALKRCQTEIERLSIENGRMRRALQAISSSQFKGHDWPEVYDRLLALACEGLGVDKERPATSV